MTPRSSNRLLLLGALLALALAIAGWRASSGRTSVHIVRAGPAEIGESEWTEVLESSPEGGAEALLLETSTEAPTPIPVERKPAATLQDLALADAIWVEGSVRFPEGWTSASPVHVVARGRKSRTNQAPEHRVAVGADGSFRVAFGRLTRVGTIDLDGSPLIGRTLRLQFPKLRAGETPAHRAPVVLEAVLAASIAGRLVLPEGTEQLGDRALRDTIIVHESAPNSSDSRRIPVPLDADLRFELHGLDPRSVYEVEASVPRIPSHSVRNLRLAPGERRELVLEPPLGARLVGRVVGPGGVPSTRISLWYSMMEPDGVSDAELCGFATEASAGSLDVDSHGRFDVRVPSGRLELIATADQRVHARIDLDVVDQEVREGLELALGIGKPISGRVLWSDGTPAVGVSVEVRELSGGCLGTITDYESGEVQTDEHGRFHVDGTSQGSYWIHAWADFRVPPEEGRTKESTKGWAASLGDVASGAVGCELVLKADQEYEVRSAGPGRFVLEVVPKR